MPRGKPVVIARFKVSWDGRLLELPALRGTEDGDTFLEGMDCNIDFAAMLRGWLPAEGVRRVIINGDPAIFRAMLAGGLVDELHLTLVPQLAGENEASTITGKPAEYLPGSIPCKLLQVEQQGNECILRYKIPGKATKC